MKRQGREPKPLTAEEKALVEEFIQNSDSYDQFAEKHGITKAQLRYKVTKYRKEQTDNGKENS